LIVLAEGSRSYLSSTRFCTVVGIFDTLAGNIGAPSMVETVDPVRKTSFLRDFSPLKRDRVKPVGGLPVVVL